MDDIEKLFKEKLAQHTVAPPPQVWEQLEQAQEKKKGAWWWMAASVAILLLAGVALVFTQQSTINDTVAIDLPSIQSETPDLPTIEMLKPLPKHLPNVAGPAVAAKITPSVTTISSTSTSQAAEVNTTTYPATLAKIETISPVVSQSSLDQLPQTLLVAEATVPPRTTVTIIYKSGKADDSATEEHKKPLKKAFAFLADLKEGGVGFSELRSAKSEIIYKAFSSKREPMAAE